MRTFYVFNIKKEISILTKDTPYNLFKTIYNLYYIDNYSSNLSYNMFDNIFNKVNKKYIDNKINNVYKDNRHYRYNKEKDIHEIHNKYLGEDTSLKVYNSYIIIRSNMIKPSMLLNYLDNNNLFVCDFKNKDYFWLNNIFI